MEVVVGITASGAESLVNNALDSTWTILPLLGDYVDTDNSALYVAKIGPRVHVAGYLRITQTSHTTYMYLANSTQIPPKFRTYTYFPSAYSFISIGTITTNTATHSATRQSDTLILARGTNRLALRSNVTSLGSTPLDVVVNGSW